MSSPLRHTPIPREIISREPANGEVTTRRITREEWDERFDEPYPDTFAKPKKPQKLNWNKGLISAKARKRAAQKGRGGA